MNSPPLDEFPTEDESGSKMVSKMNSPPHDESGSRAAFRKPGNDNVNRKYRRRSPASGSQSSDGSPKRGRSSSPVLSRGDLAKKSDSRKVDDVREFDRDPGRSQHSRRGDSYRKFDQQSSRGSHDYGKHEDYRHGRHANHDERNHKSSYRTDGSSRDVTRSDKYNAENIPSRDYARNADRYPRNKYDVAGHRPMNKERDEKNYNDRDLSSHRAGSERRGTSSTYDDNKPGEHDKHTRAEDGRGEKMRHHRGIGDGISDTPVFHEKSRGKHTESTSRKDSGVRLREDSHKRVIEESDGSKHNSQEKRKYEDWEPNRHKEHFSRKTGQVEEKTDIRSKTQDFAHEKSGSDCRKSGVEPTGGSTSSKHVREAVGKMTLEQVQPNTSDSATDLNAAKVAAIRAAELVNRNLVGVGAGTGVLSTDQKKKLLWGNKKNAAAEESGHRWDTPLFPDRERQEKFNKLMGVKGEVKTLEENQENQDGSSLMRAEKEKEFQLDLEKQYTAGLRRRDGRTVGLGL